MRGRRCSHSNGCPTRGVVGSNRARHAMAPQQIRRGVTASTRLPTVGPTARGLIPARVIGPTFKRRATNTKAACAASTGACLSPPVHGRAPDAEASGYQYQGRLRGLRWGMSQPARSRANDGGTTSRLPLAESLRRGFGKRQRAIQSRFKDLAQRATRWQIVLGDSCLRHPLLIERRHVAAGNLVQCTQP